MLQHGRSVQAPAAAAQGASLSAAPQQHRHSLQAGQRLSVGRHEQLLLGSAVRLSGLAAPSGRAGLCSPVRAAAAPAADEQLTVAEERLPGCVVQLTITVPPSACKKAYDVVLKSYAKKVDMPGFRAGAKGGKGKGKGKGGSKGGGGLSGQLLVNYIGGEEKVKSAAVEQLLITTLPQALQRFQSAAIGGSEAVHSDAGELVAAFNVGKPLTYVASVQLPPTVTWAGDYREIAVEVEHAADPDSVAADVDARLREELKKGAVMRIVADRGLERSDIAVVNTRMRRADNGATLGERSRMQLDMETADDKFMPGLADALLGARPGDSRTATLTLPPDFEPKALAGQQVECDVDLLELFRYELPAMDDAWANKLFPGCSLAKAREVLTSSYMQQAQEETQRRVRAALTKAVGGLVRAELPEALVRSYGEAEYQARLIEALDKGALTFEQMESLATEELLDQFVASKRGELEGMVREVAGCEQIMAEQGMAVEAAEVEREFFAAAARFKQQNQEFDEGKLREQVEETLKAEKVMDWLSQHVTVTLVKPKRG